MGKINLRNRNLNQFDKNGKLKAPNWEYRFETARINGKRKSVSKAGFRTKKEAEAAGTQAMSEYNNSGLMFKPSDISVSDYLDYWIKSYCDVNLKPTTVSGYIKRINNHIKPAIGKYHLKSVQPATLQALIDDMFNSGYSRNTLTCIKGILTGSLNYAVEPCGFIKLNPALLIRLPKSRAKAKIPTKKKIKRPVTNDEWKKIVGRFPEGEPSHIPLILAYRCGLRMGEVFGLMWDDIDTDQGTITIKRQVQKVTGQDHWTLSMPKYDSCRTIKIDSDTMDLLKRERTRQQDNRKEYAEYYKQLYISGTEPNDINLTSGYITHTVTDTPADMVMQRESGEYIQPRIIQHVSRVIHGVYKDTYPVISSDFDFHSLRTTHASMLREQGVPEALIQERLGHADIKITEKYIKPTEGMRKSFKDTIENLYKNKDS